MVSSVSANFHLPTNFLFMIEKSVAAKAKIGKSCSDSF